jgi:very-short-patch-repair endonuclease
MDVTEKARELRRKQTDWEGIFWGKVRNRKIGFKFIRQKPILYDDSGRKRAFYADFYCPEKKLIIELDGKGHDNQTEYDTKRDNILHNLGYRVLRIKNEELEYNMLKVLQKIITL